MSGQIPACRQAGHLLRKIKNLATIFCESPEEFTTKGSAIKNLLSEDSSALNEIIMDFNDIQSRLERTLVAMNGRFNRDLGKAVNVEVVQTPTTKGFKINFGSDSEEELINKIFLILYNLATLKDHTKNALEKKGVDGKIIEDTIDSSLHLSVLIDLVNQDKHEYPLTKTNRSNKNPILKNINQVLRITASKESPSASFVFNPSTMSYTSQGDNSVVIYAEIHDDKGNQLFLLDELVENSFSLFEKIIKDNQLI